MRVRAALAILATVCASTLAAKAPDHSLRPVARGDLEQTTIVRVRPKLRPVGLVIEEGDTSLPVAMMAAGLTFSLRPQLRPDAVVEKAMAKRRARRSGAVCGDVNIQGEEVGYIPGKLKGCGLNDAVKISSISGVTLSQKSVMDCTTAKSMKRWVDRGLKPAVGNYGGGVQSLKIAAHYACRTRNSMPGAKISEHGRGRAVDISAIQLRNGSDITVLKGWGERKQGRILKEAHKKACREFGTVLGPEANAFHRDHFHFDTARYRSGSYCR